MLVLACLAPFLAPHSEMTKSGVINGMMGIGVLLGLTMATAIMFSMKLDGLVSFSWPSVFAPVYCLLFMMTLAFIPIVVSSAKSTGVSHAFLVLLMLLLGIVQAFLQAYKMEGVLRFSWFAVQAPTIAVNILPFVALCSNCSSGARAGLLALLGYGAIGWPLFITQMLLCAIQEGLITITYVQAFIPLFIELALLTLIVMIGLVILAFQLHRRIFA
eukprot:TRINITY_DN6033_c0_g1_i2.p2 TRINITY_DN6033_c0_g1~~TRINITY_DN6033_c0_g1_i2.p2  ORF type:complete len:216 (+),score=29.30 TRINITY_DN6033_c0_g1_i2:629-1276(+)